MLENNLKNKAKFFAQYYEQQVRAWKSRGYVTDFIYHVDNGSFATDVVEHSNLQLKPISAISDEDARDYLIAIGVATPIKRINSFIANIENYLDDSFAIDFLRSRGYLLEFMGLQPQDIIDRGWVVLEQPETK